VVHLTGAGQNPEAGFVLDEQGGKEMRVEAAGVFKRINGGIEVFCPEVERGVAEG
jgi:hypothetical protein